MNIFKMPITIILLHCLIIIENGERCESMLIKGLRVRVVRPHAWGYRLSVSIPRGALFIPPVYLLHLLHYLLFHLFLSPILFKFASLLPLRFLWLLLPLLPLLNEFLFPLSLAFSAPDPHTKSNCT